MVGNCVDGMSRRRLLLIWTISLSLVLLIYIYLPYTVGKPRNPIAELDKEKKISAVIPVVVEATEQHIRERVNIHTTSTGRVKETSQAPTSTPKPTVPKTCVVDQSLLVGAVYVNQTVPDMNEVIKDLSVEYGGSVEKGGAYRPKGCIAKNKLAIVIPYRNRSEHLRIFLRHMHPIMQRQMHDYRIIVVEQAGNYSFNRATLINIGFLEALKIASFECFVFHDVDHILENDRNDYGCPETPKLLGVSVDRFHRRFPYLRYFGGVGAFSKEQFEKMNGYSNMFWGWGGEDDDAYKRIRAAGYSLLRPPANIGRYRMLKEHHVRDKPGPDRHGLLRTSVKRMHEDGLNTVKYEVKEKTEYPLYTHILAKLAEELDVRPTVILTLKPAWN